jgi:hypothetical protein
MKRYGLAVLAYLAPTFTLGYLWHLVLFQSYYEALVIYRQDVIIPFGLLSILIQATIFAWMCDKTFTGAGGHLPSRSLRYGAVGAVLSWSFTTLAVSAKNLMASVPDYILIETAFTIAQWALVAPLTVLALQAREVRGRVGAADENPIAAA